VSAASILAAGLLVAFPAPAQAVYVDPVGREDRPHDPHWSPLYQGARRPR
jgi:hypothetical protein